MKPIICAQCQKELPDNYEGGNCPYCGAERQQTVAPEQRADAFRISLWIFFAVVLIPPLLTLLAAFFTKAQSDGGAAPAVALLGGAASGIACGVMLALRIGRNIAARVVLGILFSCVMVVVCIMLNFFGCMVGGYQFTLR